MGLYHKKGALEEIEGEDEMKIGLSLKLMEILNKTPLANAWWMDDHEGNLYAVYTGPDADIFYETTGITSIYRRVARIDLHFDPFKGED